MSSAIELGHAIAPLLEARSLALAQKGLKSTEL